MSYEFRVFLKLDEHCEASIAVLQGLGWSAKEGQEEVREDEYVALKSDVVGAKRRAGKKWEAKFRCGHDEQSGIERFVKRKYGKKGGLDAHVLELSDTLTELGLAWDGSPDFKGRSILLAKRRQMLAVAGKSSCSLEVCLVTCKSREPWETWASISVESDSLQDVKDELAHSKYRNLFDHVRSISASSSRSWMLGGYPRFVRLLDQGLSDEEFEHMGRSITMTTSIETTEVPLP